MDRISFTIFIPDGEKFHLTPNWIVGGLWAFTIAILWLFDGFIPPYSTFRYIWLGIVLAITIYFIIAAFFTFEALNGTLKGKIIFEDDDLIINDEVFKLTEISKIDFWFGNYYGEMGMGYRGNFNPLLYQGVRNSITFTDKTNQSREIRFQMMGKHSSMALYPFINEAVKAGAMSYIRAIDIIGVENVTKPD